jgi:hypothetical protein
VGDEINRNAAEFCGVVVPAMASADASHSSYKCRWYGIEGSARKPD